MGPSTPFSSWQTLSVVADIMCDMANISRFMAGITQGMAIILRIVPEIFHVKHQFFENVFEKGFGLFKGKNALFQKYSKIGLVAKKLIITFKGGGSEPKVININLFFYFF